MPDSSSQTAYIALCPNASSRQRITDIAHKAKELLGENFTAQYPCNMHLTIGRQPMDEMSSHFPISPADKKLMRHRPTIKQLASPYTSDAGTPYLDLFYRPSTREFSLALCIPFTAAARWKGQGGAIEPHITLGKIFLDDTQDTAETRAKYRLELYSHEGMFADFAALGESIQAEYALNGGFTFNAVYLAPADNTRLSVPRGPALPEYGKSACR